MFGRPGIEVPLLMAGFAVVMLVRHVPGARRRNPVSIITCVLAVAVLVASARAMLTGS
jgi:hypothetical protein